MSTGSKGCLALLGASLLAGAGPASSFEQGLQEAQPGKVSTVASLADSDGMACDTIYQAEKMPAGRAGETSALVEGAVRHDVARALDGELGTAWVEGVAGPGVGEGVFLLFPGYDKPSGLSLVPGYAKDEKRWTANNRVSAVLIRWLKPKDGAEEPASGWRREDLVYTRRVGLRVELGAPPMGQVQYIDFGSHWAYEMEETETVGLEVQIVSVVKGSQHDDTCISELQLLRQGAKLGTQCAAGWCKNNPNAREGCEHAR